MQVEDRWSAVVDALEPLALVRRRSGSPGWEFVFANGPFRVAVGRAAEPGRVSPLPMIEPETTLFDLLECDDPGRCDLEQIWSGVRYHLRAVPLEDGLVLLHGRDIDRWIAPVHRVGTTDNPDIRAAFDSMIDPLFVVTAVRNHGDGDAAGEVVDFRYERVNPAGAALYQLEPGHIVGHTMLEMFPNLAGTELFDDHVRLVEGGEPFKTNVPFTGGVVEGWFELQGTRLGDGAVVSARDVTARMHSSSTASRTGLTIATFLRSAPDAVAIIDATGRLLLCNEVLARQAGRAAADLIGRPVDDPDGLPFGPRVRAMQEAARSIGGPVSEVFRLPATEHHPGGWHEAVVVPEFDNGLPTGRVVYSGRDVTVRRQWEDRLAREALVDPLTGLANRRLLLERLGQDLVSSTPGVLAVIAMDIAAFKDINEQLGHAAGDAILRSVSERLRNATRSVDTVARVGADEFVIVAPGLPDVDTAGLVAARVLEVFRHPFTVASAERDLQVGLGLAVTNAGAAGVEPERLLRDAAIALERAKGRPGSRLEVFDTTLRIDLEARVDAEQSIRRDLAEGRFVPWFQPEVDLVTGEILAFEALVRRTRADGRVVAAGEFVALAESSGLICALGSRVLDEVCERLAEWRSRLGARTPFVWVNLSARELGEPGAAERMLEVLGRFGLDGGSVGFEITETAVFAEVSTVVGNLDRLRRSGFRFAIDDYGTGYASLAHLKDLRVHALKIDRSFVSELPEDRVDQAIVSGAVSLARELGYRVIGEGIETERQRDALVSRGCRTGQGFLFSPAVPAEEVVDLVERQPFRVGV